MTMNRKEFTENVRVYGSHVRTWPEGLREAGLKALESSAELRAFLADEERFERLLKARRYEEPSRDLAERIISASLHTKKKARQTLGGFFTELLWEFSLPKPAVTAVCVSLFLVLIIGFGIGFLNPAGPVSTEEYQTQLEEFLYYEGEVL